MSNYTHHLLHDWDWYKTYQSLLGKDKYQEYFNRVYAMLFEIPEEKFFDIEKNVSEENRDLFIKICCLFVLEQRRYIGDFWTFNETFTQFKHIKHYCSKQIYKRTCIYQKQTKRKS
jgi:hypothetical protein